MEGDLAGYRSRRAGRMARKHLRDAKKALSQGDSGNFTSALSLGLRNYLRDRLASYRNDEDSLNALAESGVSHEDCETFRSLLGDCDFARFAPGDREQLQGELLQRAELLLSRLEKTRKRSSLPLSVLLLLLLAFPVMADTEESMLEAAERYEAGQFSHAAAQWQDLADSGLEDSQLWYNLGNARFQEEKIGEAILSWRRALRLAPRDRMSRENLEIARARVLHELPPAEASISSKLWMGLRSILSPGEMALFALLFLWSLSILVLLLVLRRASWTRLRVPVWLFLLLFLLASLAMGKAEREDWGGRQAILLAPSVTLLSGPGEDFLSIVEIHEGSELEIRETRGEWMRIRMHGDLEGWLLSGTVERL